MGEAAHAQIPTTTTTRRGAAPRTSSCSWAGNAGRRVEGRAAGSSLSYHIRITSSTLWSVPDFKFLNLQALAVLCLYHLRPLFGEEPFFSSSTSFSSSTLQEPSWNLKAETDLGPASARSGDAQSHLSHCGTDAHCTFCKLQCKLQCLTIHKTSYFYSACER